ncbi:MAG TPA: hypothetical protein VMF86_04915 [Stellaceae bacterium]|nr:hypothetical protein [Stellaceae bacterium]
MMTAILRRRRSIGLAAALLTVACAAVTDRAAAGFASVEPEVRSAAALPGMPPAPVLPPSLSTTPAPPASGAATPQQPSSPTTTAAVPPEAPPQAANGAPQAAGGLAVVDWGLGPRLGSAATALPVGQPLYLWMTIAGGQAAVARLQAGPIAIDVHWTRVAAGASSGAPDLTTRLTVGQPDLVPVYAGEVYRQGYFEWHSWARKDTLSPGAWTVSLTYGDGQPLMCGVATPRPCRFSITIG